MPARIIDGKAMSEEILRSIADRVAALQQKGVTPGLAVVLVGEDPASQIYVRNKQNACKQTGVYSKTIVLPADTTQEALESTIRALNDDPAIHGVLVQLPLPKGLDESAALAAIAPEKDVDGFHIYNAGRLLTGQRGVTACTPKGAMTMIRSTGVPLEGLEAVIVGRSNIVGKPLAMLLLQANCTVTICHSRTRDLAAHTRRADILVAAVGQPEMIKADMVKEGAIVIDVGINRLEGRIVGDVDFASVSEKAAYITPVPGGVGKMTIAMLMDNTVAAAEKAAAL